MSGAKGNLRVKTRSNKDILRENEEPLCGQGREHREERCERRGEHLRPSRTDKAELETLVV